MFVAGIVLAAGGSRRLGRPKQLLPYRGATVLDATLDMARECRFDQLLVTLGGAGGEVRDRVDLSGADVVGNPDFGTGCGGSIAATVGHLDARADAVVLLLGDQPGVRAGSVRALIDVSAGAAIGICRYGDGLGHPFWFGRELFGELGQLHGDKAVWKLLHSGRSRAVECPVDGPVPGDVDTWEDYQALVRG